MSSLALADLMIEARRAVNDTGEGRNALVRLEQVGGIDGTEKNFTLLYFPVVAPTPPATSGTVEVLKNGAALVEGVGYTIDYPGGLLKLAAAPVKGPPKDVIEITYRFYWYDDAQFESFLANAATSAGFPPTGSSSHARALSVAATFPDGMLDSLMAFTGYEFNLRRADEYAHRFSSSSGGQSANVDVVTGNFRKLAQDCHTLGIEKRDDFYKRRGARNAPATAIGVYSPIGTTIGNQGTPRR